MGTEEGAEGETSRFRISWCVPCTLARSTLSLTLPLDAAHAARRRYKKDLDHLKPDLTAYNRQKEIAMGYAPGRLTSFNPSSSTDVWCLFSLLSYTQLVCFQLAPTSHEQQLAAENLYRDANTLIYGDSKPSEEAIDRVVDKLDRECVTMSLCISSSSQLSIQS